MGDFVNRRIVSKNDAKAELGVSGAIQAAIDTLDNSASGANRLNNPGNTTTNTLPTTPSKQLNWKHWGSSSDSSPNFKNNAGNRNAGTAGTITQGDILASIGSVISARSDTFRIRAYGESIQPGTTNVRARAWCEAIVQRLPDYLEDETIPGGDAAWSKVPPANERNKKFGRHYTISSFRWLAADEI